MNDSTEPLAPDAVDELLSAALDGELAAAAADLGLTEEEAERRLAATPGVETRRAHLGRARAVLAVEPLSADTRDALVQRAVAEGPVDELTARRRRRVLPIIAGSVAAALLLVVGVTTWAGNDDENADMSVADAPAADEAGGEDSESLAGDVETTLDAGAGVGVDSDDSAEATEEQGAPVPESTTLTSRVATFGDVSDAASLRSEARAAIGTQPRSSTAAGNNYNGPPSTLADAAAARLLEAECVTERADGAPIVVRGPAQYDGKEAEVLIVLRDDFYEVLVLSPDCTLLASQFIAS